MVGVEHPPQIFSGEDELRGLGAPVVKSALLLSVSVQPLLKRSAAVVLESVAVGALPSAQVEPVPYDTTSTAAFVAGQPLNAVVELTNATFPAVPLKASVPVALGIGKLTVPPVPADSCTK